MFKPSAIMATDFYKIGHVFQYPKGTTKVYSNLTARSDKYTICKDSPYYDYRIVFFGLQYYIKSYLVDSFNETFFNVPLEKILTDYKKRMDTSLGKDSISMHHIEVLHILGYLPIEIKAIDEGYRLPMRVPMLTITNTLPEFYWLTNFLETSLSAVLWKLCNNATIAYEYKRIFTEYAKKTGADLGFIQFQGHDFSFRGLSGIEDAFASGMAHLTSFVGTDTIPAIDAAEYYYKADGLIGCSVPATEHSVMCANGKETELETYRRLITEVYPSGIVSIVSDTWDFWKVVTEYTSELKDVILARDGKVVIRPDSGNPADIICGESYYSAISLEEAKVEAEDNAWDKASKELKSDSDICAVNDIEYIYNINGKYYVVKCEIQCIKECSSYSDTDIYTVDNIKVTSAEIILEPSTKGAIECLWDIFGGTINEKGYKVLNPKIGLIYGDSITIQIANNILDRLEKKGFASSNVVFGIGSYTYNYSTRDSFGMAVKSTYVEINGQPYEIEKDPKTGDGIKKSAKGLLQITEDSEGIYSFKDQCTKEEEQSGVLTTVFKDGKLVKELTLNEIRSNLA
jgi:nicotinamide phosphoribosyltransferase